MNWLVEKDFEVPQGIEGKMLEIYVPGNYSSANGYTTK